ncbi:hypothetical protein AVEN_77841-1 [Araneus ventricosus]|uniref:RNase H type-1 domain-containing protein n=1 Tax=Araneus ventricosus TaxID=182803 RepID=A0A4Y2GMR1_ARAVE|nr:hypothetical protein AVEN_77841-1 [Araneus ventricosus]
MDIIRQSKFNTTLERLEQRGRYYTYLYSGISILKLLRHIGVDHEVHLQWITFHVDIYGNEVAVNLAKQGTAEPLCSTPSLTFDEIYSIRKNKDLKTWRVPPSHD